MAVFGDMPVWPFLVMVGGGAVAGLFLTIAVVWWGLRIAKRKRGKSNQPPSSTEETL